MTLPRRVCTPYERRSPGVFRRGWRLSAAWLALSASLMGSDLVRKNLLQAPVPEPVTVDIRLPQSELDLIRTPAMSESSRDNLINPNAPGWLTRTIVVSIIGAQQDKNLSRQAERLAVEIRDMMAGIDYKAALVQRYEAGVNTALIPVIGEVSFSSNDAQSEALDGRIANQANLMTVQYAYGLTQDFKTLQVTLHAELWDRDLDTVQSKDSGKKIREAARYFQNFTYKMTPASMASSKAANQRAELWTELGKEKLASMILGGMMSLADALGYDLGSGTEETSLGMVDYQTTDGSPARARLVKEVGNQRWSRTLNGELLVLEQE